MIPKLPKRPPFFKRIIVGVAIFEALAFGGSYLIWRKLNNSREYREKAKESAPWALEIYYKMGEMMSDKNKTIREADHQTWNYSATKKQAEN